MEDVIELKLGFVPEAAVSGAFLIQDEYRTFLTFNAMKQEVDGAFLDAGTAIIELVRCSTTKFGYPNDEALEGHPLYRKGLRSYSLFEVVNSNWIAEQERQNRVNFPDRTDMRWKRHFIFTFHDSTFECLAADIRLEVSSEPFDQILQRLSKRFLEAF
jgi:hypothetical protein